MIVLVYVSVLKKSQVTTDQILLFCLWIKYIKSMRYQCQNSNTCTIPCTLLLSLMQFIFGVYVRIQMQCGCRLSYIWGSNYGLEPNFEKLRMAFRQYPNTFLGGENSMSNLGSDHVQIRSFIHNVAVNKIIIRTDEFVSCIIFSVRM